MNKAELVEEVASRTGLTKRASREAVDTITSVIMDTLARGEKVILVGFGTFRVIRRMERTGINPQTGERIEISAREVPKFEPGKKLRETLYPEPPPYPQ